MVKLIVQRVARATVEVDGYVESRIGSGIVLSLAVRAGDTVEKARKVATQVIKLKLWPQMLEPEKVWSTNVIDNGYEVLVVCQQSLNAVFPKEVPTDATPMKEIEAKKIFQAFVTQLRKEYQEEMVVDAPLAANLRVEATLDGAGMFEFGSDPAPAAATPASKVAKAGTSAPDLSEERKVMEVKKEYADWTGRAAPNTPGMQPWGKGYGKKGGGKGRQWVAGRSYGIASLDESLKIHGGGHGAFDFGQLSSIPDASMRVGGPRIKHEMDETSKVVAPPLKRLKGTPTVAPSCPAPGEEATEEEVWDEL